MKKKAFSLIELLVIVSFLSIIVLVASFAFSRQISKGYDARRKSDLNLIKIAIEEYEKDHNCYPPYLPSCKASNAGILRSYIPNIPCDPHTKTDYLYYADPNSVCSKWAWIFSNLEDTSDPKIGEIGCQSGCGPNRDGSFNYYVATPGAPDPFKSGNPNVPPDVNGDFYGCFSGVCQHIEINPDTHLPICQPNFTSSDCRNLCQDESGPINECNPY